MLQLLAQAMRNSAAAVAGLTCVVAAFAAFFVPLGPLVVWVGLQASLLGLAHRLAVVFLDRPAKATDAKLWQWRFIGFEAVRGLVWGVLAGLVAASDNPTALAFSFTTLLAASTMIATVDASIPAAVVGAMTSMSAIALLGLLSSGLDRATFTVTAMGCCVQLFLMKIAQKLHTTALAALNIQDEKDGLIAELAAAKAASDFARRRAEDANFAKSRFLAAMSHELRTPLNAILGFSEVMKGEMFGAHSVASYREYLNDIHASGQHLLALINEILDLSRIEAGRFDLKEDAVRLVNVVDDCKHLLALRAKGRQISIKTTAETGLPPLRADERAIRQMVLNLLSNAINFTASGGTIRFKIGWTARGGQYFSVRDSGPGIPEEELPTIMTPFGRGTLAHQTAEEGSGLGLSIVKGLVDLHGGSFVLKSKVREGTEVIVIFPRERVSASEPDVPQYDGDSAA